MYAGPLSYISVHWVTSLVLKAYREGISEEDLYDTPLQDSSEHNSNMLVEVT